MTAFCPYITFEGTCEEALTFYKHCFGGEIVFIQYAEDSRKADYGKAPVLHSEFKAEHIHLMACDKTIGQAIHPGTNITMYLGFSNAKEQEEVFGRLLENGTVHMPLEATYWGSRLGILTDRFGVHWMLVLNR